MSDKLKKLADLIGAADKKRGEVIDEAHAERFTSEDDAETADARFKRIWNDDAAWRRL